ncbi:MAG: hypothetical protein AABZ29_05215 [Gemmatimonadota bacterium]
MQNSREAVRTEIRNQVRDAVQAAQDAATEAAQTAQTGQAGGGAGGATPKAPVAPQAPVALPPIPVGGGRLIVDKQGDRTVITSAALPPEILPLARMAQETAIGFVAILAAIFILGPFARVFARRVDRRTEIKAAGANAQLLQQQLLQLQQSVDAMSLEVERISESQRFQSKLLNDSR